MSFFWIFLLMLFFDPVVCIKDNSICSYLAENTMPKKSDFLTCDLSPIRMVAKNDTYPTADFSNFTQEEFKEVLTLKMGSQRSSDLKYFTGYFLAKESELREIHIGFEIDKKAPGIPQSFTLKNNFNLTTVIVSETLTDNAKMKFTITGNKRLSQESIAHLKQLNYISDDSVIQDFGECDVTNITSFNDLQDCHYINGDLTFSQETTSADLNLKDFPSTLTEVKGCIIIQNTSITNVDFISRFAQLKTNCKTKPVVRYNKNLCIYSEKMRKLKIEMKQFVFEENGPCADVCTWKWALANRRNPFVQCVIIQGDVDINGSRFGKEYEMLHTVQMIMGRLTIHGNSFENFTVFRNLLQVDSTDGTKPAVHIYNNPNMTFLDLSYLQKINRPASDVPLLLIEDNHDDLKFSKKQHEKMRTLGKIEIPVGDPVVTTMATTVAAQKTTTSSSPPSFVSLPWFWITFVFFK